jgi:hypothetical protein
MTEGQRQRAADHYDIAVRVAKASKYYLWDPDTVISQAMEGLCIASIDFDPARWPTGEEGFHWYAAGRIRFHLKRFNDNVAHPHAEARQIRFRHLEVPDDLSKPDGTLEDIVEREWLEVNSERVRRLMAAFTPKQQEVFEKAMRGEKMVRSGSDFQHLWIVRKYLSEMVTDAKAEDAATYTTHRFGSLRGVRGAGWSGG